MKRLFVLGFPKCGTTSLAAYLDQHPAVAVSHPKEPMYYMADYRGRRRMNDAEYARCFAINDKTVYVCDATPDYIYFPDALQHIAACRDAARYIVLFRRHEDMVASLHAQEVKNGNEDILELRDAWLLCASRRNGQHVPRACKESWRLDYVTRASMGLHLERLANIVDRQNVLFIDLAKLASDVTGVWTTVLKFLELYEPSGIEFGAHNVGLGVVHPSMLRCAKVLLNLRYKLGIQRSFGLATRIRAAGLGDSRSSHITEPELRAGLRRSFENDLSLVRTFAASGPSVLDSHW